MYLIDIEGLADLLISFDNSLRVNYFGEDVGIGHVDVFAEPLSEIDVLFLHLYLNKHIFLLFLLP